MTYRWTVLPVCGLVLVATAFAEQAEPRVSLWQAAADCTETATDWLSDQWGVLTGTQGIPTTYSLDLRIGDPNTSYIDCEFQAIGNDVLMAWQSADNELWVCKIDPLTGLMVPADGRGRKLADGLAPFMIFPKDGQFPQLGSVNGPEWGLSQKGWSLYYLKGRLNSTLQVAKVGLIDGVEQVLTSPQVPIILAAYPSLDPGDPVGRVLFARIDNTPLPTISGGWQDDDAFGNDGRFPLSKISTSGPRWIPGARALTTNVADQHGVVQIVRYDVDTSKTTMLTRGPFDKTDAMFFTPAEAPGEQWFNCIVQSKGMALFRPMGNRWTMSTMITPPGSVAPWVGLSSIGSVETFNYQGRTFFVYTATANGRYQGIYVASLDGHVNIRVSNYERDNHVDPEPVVIGDRLFVYYWKYFSPDSPAELHLCRIKN